VRSGLGRQVRSSWPFHRRTYCGRTRGNHDVAPVHAPLSRGLRCHKGRFDPKRCRDSTKCVGVYFMKVQPPEEILLHGESREVRFRWPAGDVTALCFNGLRLACRCAQCTHARRYGQPVTESTDVEVVDIVPFGVSGVRFVFSDGHERGIFPWRYLWELSANESSRQMNRPA